MRPNTIRSIWNNAGCALNGWLHLPDSMAAETMAHCGWDSLTIDMQHGVIDYSAALGIVQAISTTAVIPMARVPWNDPGMIMKLLDAGCYGIICPMINTPEQCAAFVGACRYPPRGYRSYGPVRATLYGGDDYAAHANEVIIAMAMIETREAVENLEAILSTPGLDAIYIGPADLSQSLGFAPQVDPQEPRIVAVIDDIVRQAREHNVVAGIHTGSVEYARRMAARGMQMVTIGSDARLLAGAARVTTTAFKNGADGPETTGY